MSTCVGHEAEQQARIFLEQHDYRFIAANVRYRFAEIDLIMKKASTIVFVEVKYRKRRNFGGAVAAIAPQQQRRLQRAANYYLQQNRIKTAARFDVIAIEDKQINWIKNAF
tara:strand:+ start:512 stop:844 length:333 start_codon:yes stop_codon:yes gene_type:complete